MCCCWIQAVVITLFKNGMVLPVLKEAVICPSSVLDTFCPVSATLSRKAWWKNIQSSRVALNSYLDSLQLDFRSVYTIKVALITPVDVLWQNWDDRMMHLRCPLKQPSLHPYTPTSQFRCSWPLHKALSMIFLPRTGLGHQMKLSGKLIQDFEYAVVLPLGCFTLCYDGSFMPIIYFVLFLILRYLSRIAFCEFMAIQTVYITT